MRPHDQTPQSSKQEASTTPIHISESQGEHSGLVENCSDSRTVTVMSASRKSVCAVHVPQHMLRSEEVCFCHESKVLAFGSLSYSIYASNFRGSYPPASNRHTGCVVIWKGSAVICLCSILNAINRYYFFMHAVQTRHLLCQSCKIHVLVK